MVLIPQVRRNAGLRRTAQAWYRSDPTAIVKNTGCNRSSQNRQLALNSDSAPSPARTCGSTHQLGVSRAAMIESIPARFGFVATPESSSFSFGREPHYRNCMGAVSTLAPAYTISPISFAGRRGLHISGKLFSERDPGLDRSWLQAALVIGHLHPRGVRRIGFKRSLDRSANPFSVGPTGVEMHEHSKRP